MAKAPPIVYLTPKQQRAQAIANTRASQVATRQAIAAARAQQMKDNNAAVAALTRQQTQSAADAKAGTDTTTGYYAALANILKGVGPAVQAGYSSAAGNDAAFGKGFSDGLAHVQGQMQQEATTNAGLSGGAAPPPVTPAAHDALYTLGGALPAQSLNAQGAAFGAAADFLPASAAGQGAASLAVQNAKNRETQAGFASQANDLTTKNGQALAALRQKGIDLANQFPGLYSQNLTAIQRNEIAKQSAAAQIAYLQQNTARSAATTVATTTKTQASYYRAYNPATGKWQKIPAGKIINAKGQVVNPPTTSKPAKPPYAQTPAGKRAANEKTFTSSHDSAYSLAQSMYLHPPTKTVESGYPPKPHKVAVPYTYKQAYAAIYNKYGVPLLRLYPQDKQWVARVVAMVHSAVAVAGFKPGP